MRILRAQSLVEFTTCLTAVILAVTVSQIYIKRSLQGRCADMVELVTEQVSPGQNQPMSQYEPYYVDQDYTVKQNRNFNVRIWRNGRQRIRFSNREEQELEPETSGSGTSTQGINCYEVQ